MNAKNNLHSMRGERLDQIGNGVLSLRNCKPVSRHNHNLTITCTAVSAFKLP
jgi:hypothetical protein